MVIVGSTDTELLTSSANFSSYSEAVARPTFSAEDVPLYLPRLDTVHRELDDWLEHGGAGGTGSTSRRKTYRLGSVGASRAQTDFYARVAASPAVRTICEVGFNAGHSTAIWLSSNPTARVHSFDLFDHTWSMGAVRILQARFPGRLTVWKGDSLRTVPRWRAAEPGARCDLVHVDGKHSYFNAVFDFVNLQLHSHAHALYLFDDQCDPTGCDVLNWRVAYATTLATCDLVASGLLEPVAALYNGSRQFALFRAASDGTAAAMHGRWRRALAGQARKGGALPLLPCSVPCRVEGKHKLFRSGNEHATNVELQRAFRPPNCSLVGV